MARNKCACGCGSGIGCCNSTLQAKPAIQFVISGTTACTGCLAFGDFDGSTAYFKIPPLFTLDGTYSINLHEDATCEWLFAVSLTLPAPIYTDAGCSIPTGTAFDQLVIGFQLIPASSGPANYWCVFAYFNGSSTSPTHVNVFIADAVCSADNSTYTMSNLITACGVVVSTFPGTGTPTPQPTSGGAIYGGTVVASIP